MTQHLAFGPLVPIGVRDHFVTSLVISLPLETGRALGSSLGKYRALVFPLSIPAAFGHARLRFPRVSVARPHDIRSVMHLRALLLSSLSGHASNFSTKLDLSSPQPLPTRSLPASEGKKAFSAHVSWTNCFHRDTSHQKEERLTVRSRLSLCR